MLPIYIIIAENISYQPNCRFNPNLRYSSYKEGTIKALHTDPTVGSNNLHNGYEKLDRNVTGVHDSIMVSISGNVDIELERL